MMAGLSLQQLGRSEVVSFGPPPVYGNYLRLDQCLSSGDGTGAGTVQELVLGEIQLYGDVYSDPSLSTLVASFRHSAFLDQDFFYWLGTNGLTESWTNPYTAGRVSLQTPPPAWSFSSDTVGHRALCDRVLAYGNSYWFMSNPALIIGFSPYIFVLKGYLFQSWENSNRLMRSWRWSSSTDGATWQVLQTVSNDYSLMSAYQTAYFLV